MIIGLSIGEYIRLTILLDTELKEILKSQVLPIVATEKSTYPLIVYKRESIAAEVLSKDYNVEREIVFSIKVVSPDYTESIELAEKVIDLFVGHRGKYNEYNIKKISLNDVEEDFDEESYTFVQNISLILNYE